MAHDPPGGTEGVAQGCRGAGQHVNVRMRHLPLDLDHNGTMGRGGERPWGSEGAKKKESEDQGGHEHAGRPG